MATEARTRTRFPELQVSGSPRQMGRSIGDATRDLIPDLIDHTLMRLNQYRDRSLSLAAALESAGTFLPAVGAHSPDSLTELEGVAEAAGVSPQAVMFLNTRAEIAALHEESALREPHDAGCTSLAVNAESSEEEVGIVGQNWDNDPGLDPFLVVLTRRPTGRPAFMTFTPPGVAAYIGLNEAGFGVCLNALPGDSSPAGIPWYFAVRGVFESRSLSEARDAIERSTRARSGNLAMMTPEGAADFEVHTDTMRELGPGPGGRLVHTNHCLHPDLGHVNDEQRDSLYGQTFDREERARALFADGAGPSSVAILQQLLSDHDGEPTSICRHPNDDPSTGWQRSVVSVVMAPSRGEMFLSRGNPCESPYERYSLN